jgi:hypothetical protein
MNKHSVNASAREWIAVVSFTLAMWATRFDHFGSMLHAPDASWAAFFIAGVMGTRIRVPLWLLVNAGVIDYLALQGGVSSYCVTPAYVFLVPTYLTLWASGRWAATTFSWNGQSLLKTAMALSIGVLSAFFISNASFYVLAGYFGNMSVLQFANAVSMYLPHFLQSSVLYTIAAGVIGYVWQHAPRAIGARALARSRTAE